MNPQKKTQFMTFTAILTAIAILIPLVMPFKIVIPPASYTLGSHVAIFIAMFLSPWMAIFVIIASSLGFLMAGYPIVIVLRAFSHIFFGSLGAFYLQKHPQTLDNPKTSLIFNFILGLVHAIAEVFACIIFYAGTGTNVENMFYVLFVLVGIGTIIHSMVDYYLALAVYKALKKTPLSVKKEEYDKKSKRSTSTTLKEAQKPQNGKRLAEHFHVTRQIIVQDIAVLRADGAPILSTNRGYIYKESKTNPYVHKLFKVKHEMEEIGQELLAIVDNGGRVQNTLIDHPVYGEIETLLKLSCRRDVQHFLEQVERSDFRPLSELTDGVHYHLVEAENEQDLLYIEKALDQLGYLVKD